jgi:hypothetical protein
MQLFEDILKANQGLQGRVQGIQYGIVATTEDPLRLGRIQCFDAAKGGKSITDWLFRVLPFPGFSPPLPLPGDTVLIGYIDGNPHEGVYFGSLQNAINPVVNKGNDLVITLGALTMTISPDGSLAIAGATSVTINDKEVLTVGSVDDDGDISQSKGW